MKHLDMMGQPCPIPLVNARRVLNEGEDAVTLDVDNFVAVQNLEKMANGEGHSFSYEKLSDKHFRVLIGGGGKAVIPKVEAHQGGMTVLIGRETLGSGSDELGRILMKGFVFALSELSNSPKVLIFLNGGAHLTNKEAQTLADLKKLEAKGARICTCGTCANYYGIADSLGVGEIVDMMTIAGLLSDAEHLVTV